MVFTPQIEQDMLQCSLCLGIVCEPITIPCGHTFCRSCLYLAMQRTKKKCPNCRAVCHVDPSSHSVNVMLANIAQKCFPKEYKKRAEECKALKQKFQTTLPIFFYNNCLFPGCLLHLHLFEQRYRHMINRCVSSNRQFLYLPNFSDYKATAGDVGLLAYVDECEFLSDGRALLKATLVKRVVITNSWVEEGTQGLHYCQYQAYEETDKTVKEADVKEIHAKVNVILQSAPGLREQIVNHIGKQVLRKRLARGVLTVFSQPPISNATQFSFWISALVTMITRAGKSGMPLLKTTKTAERLKLVKTVLSQIVSQTSRAGSKSARS